MLRLSDTRYPVQISFKIIFERIYTAASGFSATPSIGAIINFKIAMQLVRFSALR